MFVKELKMYVDYLKNEIQTMSDELTLKQVKKWNAFKSNLFNGIAYYQDLFMSFTTEDYKNIHKEFQYYKTELDAVIIPEYVKV